MWNVLSVPTLLGMLVSGALALMVYGLVRLRREDTPRASRGRRDDMLFWLLVLAAFAMGIFMTYIFVV